MVKNKMRFTLTILLMLLAGSCGRKPELPPLSSGINPIFCPRECEHMYVHAFDGDDEDAAFFFDGVLWMIMSRPEEVIAVQPEDFFLRIDMSSYTAEMVPDDVGQEFMRKNYLASRDNQMEAQMARYLSMQLGEYYGVGIPMTVEYRKESCVSISIKADKTLFGEVPGTDLSEKFEFYTIPGYYNDFLFSADKKLIGRIEEGMSIKDYLRYEPIVFPQAVFRLVEDPVELPAEVRFDVEVELRGGKTFSESVTIELI